MDVMGWHRLTPMGIAGECLAADRSVRQGMRGSPSAEAWSHILFTWSVSALTTLPILVVERAPRAARSGERLARILGWL
jgi:hypothetical protein